MAQMQKKTNAARTISNVSAQASMFIPLSLPKLLPSYIQTNDSIEWHTSSLLSLAMESITLPSRLRPEGQKRGLMADLQATLNTNGNQRISQLQCTILDPTKTEEETSESQAPYDPRIRSNPTIDMKRTEKSTANVQLILDMNLSGEESISGSRDRRRQQSHVFGAIATSRGLSKPEQTRLGIAENMLADERDGYEGEDQDIGYMRKRARFSGEPLIERYACLQLTSQPRKLVQSHSAVLPRPFLSSYLYSTT